MKALALIMKRREEGISCWTRGVEERRGIMERIERDGTLNFQGPNLLSVFQITGLGKCG